MYYIIVLEETDGGPIAIPCKTADEVREHPRAQVQGDYFIIEGTYIGSKNNLPNRKKK